MAVRLCDTCKKKGLYRCFLGLDGTCESYEKKVMTNFERIKTMSVEEMAKFLKSMVDDNETHEVACYGCIYYGCHHSDPQYKGTGLYECEGCSSEGIGLDLIKWLESEATE